MDDLYNNLKRKRQFPKANNSTLMNKVLSGDIDYEAEEYERRMEEIQKKRYQKEILDQQIRRKKEIERNEEIKNEYGWPQNSNFRNNFNNFNHNNYINLENNDISDRTHSPLIITTGQKVIGNNQIINKLSIDPNNRSKKINININNNIIMNNDNNNNNRINIGTRLNTYNNTISDYNNNNNSINFNVENNFRLNNTNLGFDERNLENQRISDDINNGFFGLNTSFDDNDSNRPFRTLPINNLTSSNLHNNEENNYNRETNNNSDYNYNYEDEEGNNNNDHNYDDGGYNEYDHNYDNEESINNDQNYDDERYNDDEQNYDNERYNNNDGFNDNGIEEGENDDLVNNDGEENANNSNNDSLFGQLPVHKFNDVDKLEENKKECSICFEKFVKNDEIATLPCIHMFHKNCIKKWLETSNICPICRLEINI